MEYRRLGRTGVRVSPICLGTDNYGFVTSEDEAMEMINVAIDAGINLLDTANVYESEPIIGKVLAENGKRHQVLIATKVHHPVGLDPTTGTSLAFISYGESQLLLDELEAAVEVAHQKGKRVCAHAGDPGMKMAIQAGVDCIEHGYNLGDEAIQMMVENDVFYVPTLVCNLDEAWLRETGLMDSEPSHADCGIAGRLLVAKSEKVTVDYAQAHRAGFHKALKAGVKIACGGDSNPIGEFALLEIEHLVRAGMGEMEALIAATRCCADLCGVIDQLGTVEAGKLADLIVLSGDPLQEISNIRKLKLVLKGGRPIHAERPEGLKDLWELLFF